MQIHQDWQWLEPTAQGASCALGNFDGVHLGHQSVIKIARDWAEAHDHPPVGVISFEPHPRQFFAPNSPAFRLMSAQTRANRLGKLGIDQLYQLPFNTTLAAMTPRDFAHNILANGLGVKHVVVGPDFCFGNDRKGTAQDLQRFGHEFGFATTIAPLLAHDGVNISSTAIRQALSEGRLRDVAAMLGHWHRIDGEVIHGEKRGRELGFPTANMALDGLHLLKFGVYAVRVDVLSGPQAGSYMGAASLGVRPMFDGQVPNLETYLLDFKGDLYGRQISVAFIEYLRPEAKFDGLDALIAQMDKDCLKAREILSQTGSYWIPTA